MCSFPFLFSFSLALGVLSAKGGRKHKVKLVPPPLERRGGGGSVGWYVQRYVGRAKLKSEALHAAIINGCLLDRGVAHTFLLRT